MGTQFPTCIQRAQSCQEGQHPATPRHAVPSLQALPRASEEAGGSKQRAPGDSLAEAPFLEDLRLPAPHSACPGLPGTHYFLKAEV